MHVYLNTFYRSLSKHGEEIALLFVFLTQRFLSLAYFSPIHRAFNFFFPPELFCFSLMLRQAIITLKLNSTIAKVCVDFFSPRQQRDSCVFVRRGKKKLEAVNRNVG